MLGPTIAVTIVLCRQLLNFDVPVILGQPPYARGPRCLNHLRMPCEELRWPCRFMTDAQLQSVMNQVISAHMGELLIRGFTEAFGER